MIAVHSCRIIGLMDIGFFKQQFETLVVFVRAYQLHSFAGDFKPSVLCIVIRRFRPCLCLEMTISLLQVSELRDGKRVSSQAETMRNS